MSMKVLFIFNLVGTGILFKLNQIQNTHRVEFMCVYFDILLLILDKRDMFAHLRKILRSTLPTM